MTEFTATCQFLPKQKLPFLSSVWNKALRWNALETLQCKAWTAEPRPLWKSTTACMRCRPTRRNKKWVSASVAITSRGCRSHVSPIHVCFFFVFPIVWYKTLPKSHIFSSAKHSSWKTWFEDIVVVNRKWKLSFSLSKQTENPNCGKLEVCHTILLACTDWSSERGGRCCTAPGCVFGRAQIRHSATTSISMLVHASLWNSLPARRFEAKQRNNPAAKRGVVVSCSHNRTTWKRNRKQKNTHFPCRFVLFYVSSRNLKGFSSACPYHVRWSRNGSSITWQSCFFLWQWKHWLPAMNSFPKDYYTELDVAFRRRKQSACDVAVKGLKMLPKALCLYPAGGLHGWGRWDAFFEWDLTRGLIYPF